MLLLRCTQKLQEKLGLKKKDLEQDIPDNLSPIAQWHAHLFWVFRIPNIVFVNDESLFSFAVIDINREKTKNLLGLFIDGFSQALIWHGYDKTFIEGLTNQFIEIRYTDKTNRSVLGSINELIRCHYHGQISDDGGVFSCDLRQVTLDANIMPHLVRNDIEMKIISVTEKSTD